MLIQHISQEEKLKMSIPNNNKICNIDSNRTMTRKNDDSSHTHKEEETESVNRVLFIQQQCITIKCKISMVKITVYPNQNTTLKQYNRVPTPIVLKTNKKL